MRHLSFVVLNGDRLPRSLVLVILRHDDVAEPALEVGWIVRRAVLLRCLPDAPGALLVG
jgi:hypothetical protein